MRLVLAILPAGAAGSVARGDKIAELAQSACYPEGKRQGKPIPERTLRSWVATYERRGMLGLQRARRADHKKARVIVSRPWDKAMTAAGVSEQAQKSMAEQVTRLIKSLWASGASSGANVQFLASPDLRDIASAAAPGLTRPQLDGICRLPPDLIRRFQRARLAHQKKTDAGGWASNKEPRIRRDRTPLLPGQFYAADVRHSDIAVRRPDGSLATPKMIAFLDLATNRLFARVHIMPKGEMIRREHVLSAFRDLFADPSWGVARWVYLDNGGEFRTGPAANDLAAVAQFVRDIHDIEMGVFDADDARKPGTINSNPYTPQSKIIEGTFSNLTRSIEPMYPGFQGGNRMAKKVENQGREKLPMPGDEAAIKARFAQMVALHNAKPQQRGHIKGMSPNEAFARHVAAGWKSVVCLPQEFALAFGNDQFRKVKAGGEFDFGGQVYRHDDLMIRAGERIRIRVPVLDTGGRIPVLDDKGEVLCVASVTPKFAMFDGEGAREQSRRNGHLNREVKAEVDGLPGINLGEQVARVIAELPQAPEPERLATVSVSPVIKQAAQAETLPAETRPAKSRLAIAAEAARHINESLRRAG